MPEPTEVDRAIAAAERQQQEEFARAVEAHRREKAMADRHEQIAAKLDTLIREATLARQEIDRTPSLRRIAGGVIVGNLATIAIVMLVFYALFVTGVNSLFRRDVSRSFSQSSWSASPSPSTYTPAHVPK